jgi:uncharacterized membrane protein YphA (DoxX/SURF4 family)
MGFLKRKEIIFLLRIVVGVTFLYASFDKILNPGQFAIAVRGYQIIPVSASNFFALALAWAEFVSGALLLLGLFTRQAAAAIAMLLSMFVVAILAVMVRGIVIDCGCFASDGGARVGALLLVRNAFLLTACYLVMRYDNGFCSLGALLPVRS